MTNADLVMRISSLADYSGKAISGTTTTIVTSNLDDHTNSYICFLSGANAGVDRIITNSSNGTFTFGALTSAVDNTTEYAILETGYLSKITASQNIVNEMFKNIGLDYTLFLTPTQLSELYLYKALEIVCTDKIQDWNDNDFYYGQSRYYGSLFSNTFNKLKADYDSNKDGVISDDEAKASMTFASFVR